MLVDQIQQGLAIFSDGSQKLLRLVMTEHIGTHRPEAERRRYLLNHCSAGICHKQVHQHPTCKSRACAVNHILSR